MKTHIAYIVLFVVAGLGAFLAFDSWRAEHDARLLAEQQVKDSEARIKDLQAEADRKVQVITKIVHDAKTPQQVIAAIPEVSSLPLNPRPVAGDPLSVQVDAKNLLDELAAGKAAEVQLGACQEQGKEKDKEIAALKKKPGFWHRLGSGAKKVAIGVAIGYAMKGVLP